MKNLSLALPMVFVQRCKMQEVDAPRALCRFTRSFVPSVLFFGWLVGSFICPFAPQQCSFVSLFLFRIFRAFDCLALPCLGGVLRSDNGGGKAKRSPSSLRLPQEKVTERATVAAAATPSSLGPGVDIRTTIQGRARYMYSTILQALRRNHASRLITTHSFTVSGSPKKVEQNTIK